MINLKIIRFSNIKSMVNYIIQVIGKFYAKINRLLYNLKREEWKF